MNEQAQIAAWAAAHPQLTSVLSLSALVVVVALTCLAQLTLSPEQAHANPRLASAIILAQKLAPVLRGVLKPLAGIFLPKVALELVAALFPPGSSGPLSAPPVSTPKGDGGAP